LRKNKPLKDLPPNILYFFHLLLPFFFKLSPPFPSKLALRESHIPSTCGNFREVPASQRPIQTELSQNSLEKPK